MTSIGIDSMPRKSPLLCFAKWVITKAFLLLQMRNERPYLTSAYLGNIIAEAFASQEIVEVTHTIGDNGHSIFALTFSLCTERILLDEAWKLRRYF